MAAEGKQRGKREMVDNREKMKQMRFKLQAKAERAKCRVEAIVEREDGMEQAGVLLQTLEH